MDQILLLRELDFSRKRTSALALDRRAEQAGYFGGF